MIWGEDVGSGSKFWSEKVDLLYDCESLESVNGLQRTAAKTKF